MYRGTSAVLALLILLFVTAADAGEVRSKAGGHPYAELGPYPIGVKTLVIVDASRDDPYTESKRTLVVDVWYPAVDSARDQKPTTFVEFFRGHDAAAARFVERFGGDLETVNGRFVCRAVRNVPVREGSFPLLVFSHGNGGLRHQNTFQVEHLASHGYIVASPDHTGNSGVSVLDDRALFYDRQGRGRSAVDRPADVSFVIDRFVAAARSSESWLRGRVDPERIGVLGHSFGGHTCCRIAETDPRVKAILPMTVAMAAKPCRIPLFLMLARLDRTVRTSGNMVSATYYKDATGPKYLLTMKKGGHYSYTDMDYINPDFGDGIGSETKDGETVEFLPIRAAKRIINAYSVAFFDHYLVGNKEAGRFLQKNVDREAIDLEFKLPVSVTLPAAVASAPPPPKVPPQNKAAPRLLRALLVTGRDVPAHKWRETTPITREILESTKRFEVVVVEEPAVLETSALMSYDVLVVNLRNRLSERLSPEARRNVEAFVKSGRGLVALHFAVNAWEDWAEYRSMLGRYWVRRQGGKKISGHGPQGSFRVVIADKTHPVTEGLGDFEINDELYARLQGTGRIHVLASADSDWSGKKEPLAWTVSYGEGRVFVLALGHDARSRRNAGFQRLLARGSEWAATQVSD